MLGKKDNCMEYVFMTRSFWKEINVSEKKVRQLYKAYLGTKDLHISSRDDSIKYLSGITSKIQAEMTNEFKNNNPEKSIKDLYKILDEIYHFYFRQKEARSQMVEAGINSGELIDVFSENRNMARNVIDSVNLWIENCLLFQDRLTNAYDKDSFELNEELCIKMYIYGAASQALSLIAMSKKFESTELFTGVLIKPDSDVAIEAEKYHPVIYFNSALAGNQNVLSDSNELAKADESLFGIGFKTTYNLQFIYAMRMLATFESMILYDGKYAMTVIDKVDFIDAIKTYSGGLVDVEAFYDTFVLTKDRIESQKKRKDEIVWVMNANKYRHELRPFLCLENERVVISYCAIEQAKHLWLSIMLNGGMCYSNAKDDLTAAIEKRNEELSDKLVEKLRDKLRTHYKADFDEIDVRYNRIFGQKEIDYGDFDLVFYARDINELFLIEAKFFSDSLNNSGVISDYEKMFKKHGYYEHCRGRYDLVMSEPEKMKAFVGAEENVKAHFLFVSSKPLEIEFQDKDGVVTFPCLSNFDDYVDGKLLPEVGDTPVRPVHTI